MLLYPLLSIYEATAVADRILRGLYVCDVDVEQNLKSDRRPIQTSKRMELPFIGRELGG